MRGGLKVMAKCGQCGCNVSVKSGMDVKTGGRWACERGDSYPGRNHLEVSSVPVQSFRDDRTAD